MSNYFELSFKMAKMTLMKIKQGADHSPFHSPLNYNSLPPLDLKSPNQPQKVIMRPLVNGVKQPQLVLKSQNRQILPNSVSFKDRTIATIQ